MALCFKFKTGDGQETEAKFMDNTREPWAIDE